MACRCQITECIKNAEWECTCASNELVCNLHVKTYLTQSAEPNCDISSGQTVVLSETCKGLGDLWTTVLEKEGKIILYDTEEMCNESLEMESCKELSGIIESLEQKI